MLRGLIGGARLLSIIPPWAVSCCQLFTLQCSAVQCRYKLDCSALHCTALQDHRSTPATIYPKHLQLQGGGTRHQDPLPSAVLSASAVQFALQEYSNAGADFAAKLENMPRILNDSICSPHVMHRRALLQGFHCVLLADTTSNRFM
jgi:hypothetical protein